MERPCHTRFDNASKVPLSEMLPGNQRKRLSNKIASVYQEVTDITLRALAVLSALNLGDKEGVPKRLLYASRKHTPCPIENIRKISECNDGLTYTYFSTATFTGLLKSLEAAETCLKVHCVSKSDDDLVSGDQITRIKVRWHDLTSEVLKCMFELRSMGVELQGESEIKMGCTVENWLVRVRSGESLLDDASGPFFEFSEELLKMLPLNLLPSAQAAHQT